MTDHTMQPDSAIPILEKRATHLAKRMTEAEATGRVLTFDRQEYLVLAVALETLRKAVVTEPPNPQGDTQ